MFNRLKKVLVESYVGAIGLGWLLAQGIMHFANVFATPVVGWVTRNEMRGFATSSKDVAGFSFFDGLPELVRFIIVILVWYVLVRWLYFKPIQKQEIPISATEPRQTT